MVCKFRGRDGECLLECEPEYIEYCHDGPCTKEQPLAEGDRLRSMTDDELHEQS